MIYYKIIVPYFGKTLSKYFIDPISSVWNKVFSYTIAQIIAGLAILAALIAFIATDALKNGIMYIEIILHDISRFQLTQYYLTFIFFNWFRRTRKASVTVRSCHYSLNWFRFLCLPWTRQMENGLSRNFDWIYHGTSCSKMGCKYSYFSNITKIVRHEKD